MMRQAKKISFASGAVECLNHFIMFTAYRAGYDPFLVRLNGDVSADFGPVSFMFMHGFMETPGLIEIKGMPGLIDCMHGFVETPGLINILDYGIVGDNARLADRSSAVWAKFHVRPKLVSALGAMHLGTSSSRAGRWS